MGRGAKGTKVKAPAAAAEDDDALLDAAIAENARIREAEKALKDAMAKMNAKASTLTMEQTLEKLGKVMLFSIFRMMEDGSRDVCQSPDGALTFYADASDAEADLAELRALEPSAQLGLSHTSLGRAFALTQGLMGLKAPTNTRLQFSREVVAAEGDAGVPKELRAKMASAGPMPLFYSEQIDNGAVTPVFFHREDLLEYYHAAHGADAKPPQVTLTDLRVVVARTLQERGFWAPLTFARRHHGYIK